MKLAREMISLAEPNGLPAALIAHADELAAKAERLLATSEVLIGPARRAAHSNGSHSSGNGNGNGTAAATAVATHEQIHERIEQVYGARQTTEGVCFAAHAPGARRVSVAGDFNRWSCEQHIMRPGRLTGDFELSIPLPPGRYCYRLVVDGRWQHDPANQTVETNPYGELNSVVEVL